MRLPVNDGDSPLLALARALALRAETGRMWPPIDTLVADLLGQPRRVNRWVNKR